jgi:hypothetical protein
MQQDARTGHAWLQTLIGQWSFESECDMGPDQPRQQVVGRETVRAFGHWIIAEGEGGEADQEWKSVMTLAWDPAKERFVGTFVATMMTHVWVYEGTLDETGRTLTLDTEGPNFVTGGPAKYQDVIAFDADGRRTLASRMLGDDGQWHEFMTSQYRRAG